MTFSTDFQNIAAVHSLNTDFKGTVFVSNLNIVDGILLNYNIFKVIDV